ncbi:hypothetical protein [Brevibacterium aurantiacum]|nr:hypothetical protein [Brevibacterium aurantiacum]
MRVLLLSSAMLSTIVVLAFSDHLASFLIPAGQHSLAIYLIHGLIVRALDVPMDSALDLTSGSMTIVLCFCVAAIITWLLSWSRFDQAIRWYSSALAGLVTSAGSRLIPSRRAAQH